MNLTPEKDSNFKWYAGKKSNGLSMEMNFGQAIESLKMGTDVARDIWNGKIMYLSLQLADAQSKMSLPYVYMNTTKGDRVPWLPTQADMLAEDWITIPKSHIPAPLDQEPKP